jgi:EmrB/QacA subfamily drug resistance transporter
MTAQPELRVASRPGLILAVLALGGSVFTILQSLVEPALPTLQEDLGTTPSGIAWVFTTYLLAASVATPIAGRLGDMFGKKRMLVIVLCALSFGALVAGFATTLPVLILARVVQGLGGAFFPLAFGIIRDEFPRERVASGIALISGLLGIGAGLGIVLAGPILAHLSYHWLFWIPFIVLVPTIVATVVLVPESSVRAPGSVDVAGAVLLSLWLVLLLLAISQAPSWGWLSARVIGMLVLAVVAAVVWVWWERRVEHPLVDMRMMAERGVWTANVVAILMGVGMYGSFILIPQFVQAPESTGYGFGSSVTQSGLFLLPSCLVMLVAAPMAGRLSSRVGSKIPLVIGCAISVLAYLVLTFRHSTHFDIYLASLLIGLGVGFAFASLANVVVESVRMDQTGIATGMNAVMRTIGGAVGSQIAASILAANLLASGRPAEEGYTISYALMGLTVLAATFVALAVPGRRLRRAHVVPLGERVVPGK